MKTGVGGGCIVWATPASIIIAAFIVSGKLMLPGKVNLIFCSQVSLWTSPTPVPSPTRVRRDAVEPGLYDVPGIDENSNGAVFHMDSPEILEQEKRNLNRWHWIWKNKREASAEGYKIPVEVKVPVRKADGKKDSSYKKIKVNTNT